MLRSCCLLLNLLLLCTLSSSESIWSARISRLYPPKELFAHGKVSPVTIVSGGAFNITEMLQRSQTKANPVEGSSDVIVTTTVGVNILDRRKKLHLARNSTILEVKRQLNAKFPGCPPLALQRLFYSEMLLDDSVIIGSLSTLSPIVLELDMITGTSAYNRTMAVAQAVEAYVATLVHQTYLGTKLHELTTSGVNSSLTSSTHESMAYAELFKTLNDSIYEKYGEEIRLAIEAEKEPDVASADTAAWRGALDGPAPVVRPLAMALAKEFDLNWRGVRHFTYYTAILLALYLSGAAGSASGIAVLSIIPVLWLSKLRQLRILSKIGLYLVLPEVYQSEFLRPLLPAPLQVIGQQLLAMEQSGTEQVEEEEFASKQPPRRSGRAGKLWRSGFKTTVRLLGNLAGRRGKSKKAIVNGRGQKSGGSISAAALKEVERLVNGLDPWEGAAESESAQVEVPDDFTALDDNEKEGVDAEGDVADPEEGDDLDTDDTDDVDGEVDEETDLDDAGDEDVDVSDLEDADK